MRGTVKFFDRQKGWGFITSDEGIDYFVHFSAIQGKGYRYLDADDIVLFDVKECERGWQASNVQPVLTRRMVEDALKKDNLILRPYRNALGLDRYLVIDINNVIQSSEQGMTLIEAAKYAEIDVEGIMDKSDNPVIKDCAEMIAKSFDMMVDTIDKVMNKKENSTMSKNFVKNYVETVKTASQESEESILLKYNDACDNFKNLMPDEKKVLETYNISIDDSMDFPTLLIAIKNQWSTYDPITKQAICVTVAGEKSTSNVMTYLEA